LVREQLGDADARAAELEERNKELEEELAALQERCRQLEAEVAALREKLKKTKRPAELEESPSKPPKPSREKKLPDGRRAKRQTGLAVMGDALNKAVFK
jgi:chromosome segregation ATPase